MTKPDSKILDKIRAVLAVAERSSTPEEAETYLAKAAELMGRYGVERADLLADDPASDEATDTVIEVPGPHAYRKLLLLNELALALGAQTVRKRRSGAGQALHVFAYGADVERITMLWRVLAIQVCRGMQARAPLGEDTAVWRRSWLHGFHTRVIERLRAAEATAHQEASARDAGAGDRYALVVRDKDAVIRGQFQAAYPRVRHTAARAIQVSRRGYAAGMEAGNRADLGGGRLGATGTARTGITS